MWLWSVECAARVMQVWFIQVQVRYVWFKVPFWGSVHIKQLNRGLKLSVLKEAPKRVTTRCTMSLCRPSSRCLAAAGAAGKGSHLVVRGAIQACDDGNLLTSMDHAGRTRRAYGGFSPTPWLEDSNSRGGCWTFTRGCVPFNDAEIS